MTNLTIFMSNLGYLRGINGRLGHHIAYASRHFICPPHIQRRSIGQLTSILEKEDPDLCCFVEIDKGSLDSVYFNQFEALASQQYPFFDIENKYGPGSRLRTLALTRGKSNGFLAKQSFAYEKIYFTSGTKKLIYKINLLPGLTLFFAHFSLKKGVRAQQLAQVRELIKETSGEIIFLGDFNILTGFKELQGLLHENNLKILNDEAEPTFTFHRFRAALDLCICTHGIAAHSTLRIIPQDFSDHAALLLKVDTQSFHT